LTIQDLYSVRPIRFIPLFGILLNSTSASGLGIPQAFHPDSLNVVVSNRPSSFSSPIKPKALPVISPPCPIVYGIWFKHNIKWVVDNYEWEAKGA
jgi:hypothetical protein